MTRRVPLGAGFVLVALVGGTLAGCTPTGTAPAASPTASDRASRTATPRPATTSTPTTIKDAATTPAPDAAATALVAAREAVAAYCRPTANKAQWMATLSPLLTDQAVVAYQTVNPATVPCSAVTGNPSVLDGDNAYTYRIDVPTDAGTYVAYVTRARASDPWRTQRIAPPQ